MSVVYVLEFSIAHFRPPAGFMDGMWLLSSTQNESRGESDPKSACFSSLIIKLI